MNMNQVKRKCLCAFNNSFNILRKCSGMWVWDIVIWNASQNSLRYFPLDCKQQCFEVTRENSNTKPYSTFRECRKLAFIVGTLYNSCYLYFLLIKLTKIRFHSYSSTPFLDWLKSEESTVQRDYSETTTFCWITFIKAMYKIKYKNKN